MKQLVANYTFDKTAKTVTFTDYNPIVLSRILLITNTTHNIIIYNFADPLKGGTVATNVLTLTYDTSAMANTDKLQIYYDVDTSVDTQLISGTLTANAGTNLNTSALALETGGNLATIAGKDFATQTTLALIKAKTDNLDTALSGIKTGTDKIVSNAALDASVTGLQVAQGSTTSGQSGNLTQGAVTTAAPTYTTAKTNPLSLQTDGSLRTAVTNSVTVLPGNTPNTSPWLVTPHDGTNPQAFLNDNTSNVAPSATNNKPAVVGRNTVWFNANGTWERQRQVENAYNGNGTGVAGAGLIGQFDDVSPTAISENSFGNVRISSRREVYSQIRDAAGNERGANVNSSNQLSVSVDGAIAAGTNLVGDIDVAPRTTGGWLVGNYTSGDTYTALTNSAQVIKGSAGKFGGYYIYNPNTSATYVLIYNIAAASVTVGTSTAKLVFCIPASGGANLELLAGIPFDTAMSIAAATTGGGNTAPSVALEAMVFYK